MRLFLGFVVGAFAFVSVADAQVRVRGHVRKDGTYVMPHVRSAPNASRMDNWSTQPNFNPYTGKQGTEKPVPQLQWNVPKPPRTRVPGGIVCPYGSTIC